MIRMQSDSSIIKDLAQVAFDLIDGFHVGSVNTQHQQKTWSSWGFEALATATGKAAYDWIECLEKYGTGFNISLHV